MRAIEQVGSAARQDHYGTHGIRQHLIVIPATPNVNVSMIGGQLPLPYTKHHGNLAQYFSSLRLSFLPLQALTERSLPVSYQCFIHVNLVVSNITGISFIWGHSPAVTRKNIKGSNMTATASVTDLIIKIRYSDLTHGRKRYYRMYIM